MPAADVTVEVDGRSLRLTSLDKVLYPETGTTKGEVLAYYAAAAPLLLPELAGRPLTRLRWPSGTGGKSFYEKNAPRGMPDWIRTVVVDTPGSSRGRERVTYPLVESVAGLTWLGQVAALELHVPQWRVDEAGAILPPDRLVVDLDPGPGTGLRECSVVALAARELLGGMGLHEVRPVTSGSKGMQLYAALPGTHPAEQVRELARGLALALEESHADLVVSSMARSRRLGKVLVDWSQNTTAKTTICPWSLRARHRWPTVAAPREWAQVEAAAAGEATLDQVGLAAALARLS
ncbi:non-homologous end-joining DNA ligase [Arsenicicoccus dermatophilus]|uniref:non-homologous end-joining DNA ligase n=1 Tax=Arsenicicoccus dermatophilus TaxID=1076331 RepID=UPI0039174AFB